MGDTITRLGPSPWQRWRKSTVTSWPLLQKFDVLTKLEDWLSRIETTQKQMALHSQGPEQHQCKEGPLGNTHFLPQA